MRFSSPFRSAAAWRGVGVAALISSTVVAASMGLVSFRNRHRASTDAVQWAFDALRQIPEDTVVQVYSMTTFHEAVGAFDQAVRANTVPVDSVRAFYHAFALGARDGSFTPREVADLGPYLGLPSGTVSLRTPADSAPVLSDSAGMPQGE